VKVRVDETSVFYAYYSLLTLECGVLWTKVNLCSDTAFKLQVGKFDLTKVGSWKSNVFCSQTVRGNSGWTTMKVIMEV